MNRLNAVSFFFPPPPEDFVFFAGLSATALAFVVGAIDAVVGVLGPDYMMTERDENARGKGNRPQGGQRAKGRDEGGRREKVQRRIPGSS